MVAATSTGGDGDGAEYLEGPGEGGAADRGMACKGDFSEATRSACVAAAIAVAAVAAAAYAAAAIARSDAPLAVGCGGPTCGAGSSVAALRTALGAVLGAALRTEGMLVGGAQAPWSVCLDG